MKALIDLESFDKIKKIEEVPFLKIENDSVDYFSKDNIK